MDTLNNSLGVGNGNDNCVISKLRRLKIQESILTTNVTKCFVQNSEDVKYICHNKYFQFKKYICKLKDSIGETINLFDDVTTKINNEEYVDKTDMDELKKDILDLELKIRAMKKFITNELQVLQNEEIAIAKEEGTLKISLMRKKYTGQIKGYTEITPSPVRAIINSPFKCSEVQEFQDFMKNSPNRYGGWNEYNHNIFVQIWNKYYRDDMACPIKSIADTFSYHNFKEEILYKIPGSNLNSVDSHSKWYSEYMYLKFKQEVALNKWKENKNKMKPTRRVQQISCEDSPNVELKCSNNAELRRRHNKGNIMNAQGDVNIADGVRKNCISRNWKDRSYNKNIDITRLMRPTKQWILKSTTNNRPNEYKKSTDVDCIKKLRIPYWRMDLNF